MARERDMAPGEPFAEKLRALIVCGSNSLIALAEPDRAAKAMGKLVASVPSGQPCFLGDSRRARKAR